MKLIIDIPEEAYNRLMEFQVLPENIDLEYFVIHGIPLEEELEKIKEEIEEIDNIVHEHGATYINKYAIVKVFNNYISELKGENPDCRNCDKWKTCENGEKGHANGTSIGYSIGECRDYVELKGE